MSAVVHICVLCTNDNENFASACLLVYIYIYRLIYLSANFSESW